MRGKKVPAEVKEFRCRKCNKLICLFSFSGELYLQRICPSCKVRNELILRACA